ncbi:aspartate aminotransferase [Aspergillus affinis]|uniref:aspartate aminotransferase n=1 Tax=Aspergillus affinis TaxID=1070780 RepID=UPI0022FF3368|nr:aspartate transaminase [Aspergillus affinis]KAI9037978.1 aspartate transaminase [Aspergillus affinis]
MSPPASSSSPSSSSFATSARNRLASLSSHIMGSNGPSVFSTSVVSAAPEDPLFGLAQAFRQDPDDKKVDLVIGAYRDDHAKPWILPVVKKVEKFPESSCADELIRTEGYDNEYLSIKGLPGFTSAAQKVIIGPDSPAIRENRVSTLQTISGTGAVHLGALFLQKFHPANPKPRIYLSSPTWANHHQIFTNVGLTLADYPYFDKKTKGLDFAGMTSALRSAPSGSVILLHACAHNPTGVDLTQDQWKEVATIMRQGNLFPFFDCAYQGFASGDLNRDAWAVRYFIEQGFELVIAQSFAKNFGLYGQRTGAFHFVSAPGAEAEQANANVASQLAILQRSEISNPPAYGARIASRVLNDPALFAEWEADLRTMSGRIAEMRSGLRQRLESKGTPGTWAHITEQIGMFSFTGLTESQVKLLREKWHVYMTKNGRISMAGLNTHNIDYFAEAVDSVVRELS